MRMKWKLIAFVAAVAAALPAAALGAGSPWMERMMGQASEMQRMAQTPRIRHIMDNPPPGMEQMMQAPGMEQAMQNAPQGMARMMQAPGMQQMMGDGH